MTRREDILEFIKERQRTKISDITIHFDMIPASTSRILRELEDKGQIKRSTEKTGKYGRGYENYVEFLEDKEQIKRHIYGKIPPSGYRNGAPITEKLGVIRRIQESDQNGL